MYIRNIETSIQDLAERGMLTLKPEEGQILDPVAHLLLEPYIEFRKGNQTAQETFNEMRRRVEAAAAQEGLSGQTSLGLAIVRIAIDKDEKLSKGEHLEYPILLSTMIH